MSILNTFVHIFSNYCQPLLGISPLGALLGGWIAEHIGPPHSMALCGLLSLVAAGLYLMQLPAIRREILPVYRQLGIVPDARARPAGTVKPGST